MYSLGDGLHKGSYFVCLLTCVGAHVPVFSIYYVLASLCYGVLDAFVDLLSLYPRHIVGSLAWVTICFGVVPYSVPVFAWHMLVCIYIGYKRFAFEISSRVPCVYIKGMP